MIVHDTTSRIYDAVVVRNDYGMEEDEETNVKYDVRAVNTRDSIFLREVLPFRRWVFGTGQPFTIRRAPVNSPCRIAVFNGQAMVIDVLEQYVVDVCEQGV